MGKVKEFKQKEKDPYVEAMECRANMHENARVWKAVCALSEYLNDGDYTYDEFLAITSIIDHYTHHQAELEEHITKYENKDDPDFEDYYIDIDEEDGQWFHIPSIG